MCPNGHQGTSMVRKAQHFQDMKKNHCILNCWGVYHTYVGGVGFGWDPTTHTSSPLDKASLRVKTFFRIFSHHHGESERKNKVIKRSTTKISPSAFIFLQQKKKKNLRFSKVLCFFCFSYLKNNNVRNPSLLLPSSSGG